VGDRKGGIFGRAPNYDTRLDPEQEAIYQQWASAQGRLNDTQDYDLRGAWVGGGLPSSGGHFPDKFKKPNHPTFSDESQYSTPESPGGRWVQDGRGGWVFWASPANLNYQTPQGLLSYFKKVEPHALPVLPFSYKLQAR